MRFAMIPTLMSQLFKKPHTNKFPAKYAPANTTQFLADVGAGKAKLIPPVEVPPKFRGKIQYDREKCIGCQLCIKVCPTDAIQFKPDQKKVKFLMARCCFCSQCNDVCPVNCIQMSDEFLLAEADKYAPSLIVE